MPPAAPVPALTVSSRRDPRVAAAAASSSRPFNPWAQRPAHPSRKQNGGGASPYPTRREPLGRGGGEARSRERGPSPPERDTARDRRESPVFLPLSRLTGRSEGALQREKGVRLPPPRSRDPPESWKKWFVPVRGGLGAKGKCEPRGGKRRGPAGLQGALPGAGARCRRGAVKAPAQSWQ